MRETRWLVTRREVLKVSVGAMAGLAGGIGGAGCAGTRKSTKQSETGRSEMGQSGVRFGVVTDSHYSEGAPAGTRFYQESLLKMREAVECFSGEGRADFLVHLGDMKDMVKGENSEKTLSYLRAIEGEMGRFPGARYHVLGNHDMDNISKDDVAAVALNTGIGKGRTYYRFSRGGIRFIVLDACFLKNGTAYSKGNFDWRETWVPGEEIRWLQAELKESHEPVVVLAHQRLDGEGDSFVKNAAEVRTALEKSKKVLCVMTGHDHAGDQRLLNGIHYYTQKAMVEGSGTENNAYTVVEVARNQDLTITAYRRAVGMSIARAG